MSRALCPDARNLDLTADSSVPLLHYVFLPLEALGVV